MGHSEAAQYEIRVKGKLAADWRDWLGGLSLTSEPDGNTTLAGQVADDAALYGLINAIRDLGLSLQSVNRLEADGRRTAIPHAPKADLTA